MQRVGHMVQSFQSPHNTAHTDIDVTGPAFGRDTIEKPGKHSNWTIGTLVHQMFDISDRTDTQLQCGMPYVKSSHNSRRLNTQLLIDDIDTDTDPGHGDYCRQRVRQR